MDGPKKKKFESVAMKRKRKAEEEIKIKKLPSVSSFFLKKPPLEIGTYVIM